ncbi:hypothetical protein [Lentzea californiensis]|uniref:hypothetical protein n=1 Tax=Lentzea californiensis TaxID=438851 RepID=UPI002165DD98|nr:hypothetical protein [Lentzea californiensis]
MDAAPQTCHGVHSEPSSRNHSPCPVVFPADLNDPRQYVGIRDVEAERRQVGRRAEDVTECAIGRVDVLGQAAAMAFRSLLGLRSADLSSTF